MTSNPLRPQYTTFNLESFMHLGINHLENLVDSSGQPYFDVFMTTPAEAVHDWPDFVDLSSRYLEAAVMVRQMLGVKVSIEDALKSRFFSTFQSEGFAHRPETPYSRAEMHIGEQTLVLKTLNTLYMDNPEASTAQRIKGLIDALSDPSVSKEKEYFLIRAIVQSWVTLGYQPALDLAGRLSHDVVYHSNEFASDGSYAGHNHERLGILAGVLSYGIAAKNPGLIHMVKRCFDFAVSMSTRFGFVPEIIRRSSDVIGCETCAIMDYLEVAILLARNGYPQYWDVVEKATRNHLVESQIRDGSWLSNKPLKEDTDRILYRDVGKKVIGGFGGWSSPNHYLAYEDELWPSWCNDETQYPYYLGKIRALQNCCAGSGLRAIFQVWKNMAYFQGDDLYVNLHIDKKIPGLSMVSYQPYEGRMRLKIDRSCDVHIRIPDFVGHSEVKVDVNGKHSGFASEGLYATLKNVKPVTEIEMTYPLPVVDEIVTIGNPGHRAYKYRVQWKGDTVVRVDPDLNNARIGYSDLMKRNTTLYYNVDGPGNLYERGYLLGHDFKVQPANIKEDTATVDWYDLLKEK